MCYSAEASFVTAAGLGVVGGVLAKKFRGTDKFLLALVPCLFAIQQFCEGWLWVAFNNLAYPAPWSLAAHYSYLFFAYLFWPVWIPIAMAQTEPSPGRKMWMKGLFLGGLVIFVYNLYQSLEYGIAPAVVLDCSIQYGASAGFQRLFYALVVIVPFLISSINGMWVLGALITISYFVTDYFYHQTFTSLWCFHAAVVCAGLYLVLTRNRH